MSISHLPPATLTKIFLLTLPTTYHSPTCSLVTHSSPHNIAVVCRLWRRLALSTTSLWSTVYLLLDYPSIFKLMDAHMLLLRCIGYSGDTELLDCFITQVGDKFILPLASALFRHQKRWRHIEIRLSGVEREEVTAQLVLRPNELLQLESLSIDSNMRYSIAGAAPLASLTSLALALDRESEALMWLQRTPNLEHLTMTAIEDWNGISASSSKSTPDDTSPKPIIRLDRLRTLDVPLTSLPFLTCPALEDITIRLLHPTHPGNALFHALLRRSGGGSDGDTDDITYPSSLHTLRLWCKHDSSFYPTGQNDGLPHAWTRTFLVPSLRTVSVSFGRTIALHVFQALAEKQLDNENDTLAPITESTDAGALSSTLPTPFRVLPELSRIELHNVHFPHRAARGSRPRSLGRHCSWA